MAYYSVQCQKFFASDLSCFLFDSDFWGGTGQLLCPGITFSTAWWPSSCLWDFRRCEDLQTHWSRTRGWDPDQWVSLSSMILRSGFQSNLYSTWKLIDCSSHSFREWAALACKRDYSMTDRSWCHNPSEFSMTCLVGRGLCFDWKLLKGFMCCFINW